MAITKISILGSTGSIGTNTLDIIKRFPDRFSVLGLAAGENYKLLAEQVMTFRPQLVSMKNSEAADRLAKSLHATLGEESPTIVCSEEGAVKVASMPEVQIVVSAFVGAAGLVPTLEALALSKRVALANKETLVMAGEIMTRTAMEFKAEILPVDSEHSAIFQCLEGHRKEDLERIILTASGGPFLHLPIAEQKNISVKQALNHPVWKMGAKVSIDSSTMMNKGLETIEAMWLFDVNPEQIEIRIHPSSNVHSMVAYSDGSIIAQLGASDMRGPIAYALSYPERLNLPFHRFDPADSNSWEFLKVDLEQFPCVALAFKAMQSGDGYPAVLNAANEISVQKFLDGKIPYSAISEINSKVLNLAIRDNTANRADTLAEVLEIDENSRRIAGEIIHKKYGS